MRTVRQLISDTRKWSKFPPYTNIEKNAQKVRLYKWKVAEDIDEDGDKYRDVSCVARANTIPREVNMRFWGKGLGAKAFVSCSCEYFLYFCEVALWYHASSEQIFSNGEDPDETNEDKIPIVCKHIYASLKAGAHTMEPKLSPTEKRKKALEERNAKKKEREERKAKRTSRKPVKEPTKRELRELERKAKTEKRKKR